jgi:hypothetical protein
LLSPDPAFRGRLTRLFFRRLGLICNGRLTRLFFFFRGLFFSGLSLLGLLSLDSSSSPDPSSLVCTRRFFLAGLFVAGLPRSCPLGFFLGLFRGLGLPRRLSFWFFVGVLRGLLHRLKKSMLAKAN